jgi:hypothetical protein
LSFNDLNKIEPFSGFKPTPTTLAPKLFNQKLSQEPLKPVAPVTRIFLFL